MAWRIRRPGPLLVLTWLAVMLAPTLLSEYAPSFQRAIGALPVTALLIAAGLDRLVAWLSARLPRWQAWCEAAGWAVLAGSVAIMWQAFVAWSASPDLFYARDVGFVSLASALSAEPAGETIYLSPRGYDHPSMRFEFTAMAASPTLRGFDGRTCVRIAADTAASYVFLVSEDSRGLAVAQSYLPDGLSRTLVSDPAGGPWAVELAQPAGGRVLFPEMNPLPVSFDDGIQLSGYWLGDDPLKPGKRLYIRFFWHATGQPHQDYTTFAHLLWVSADGNEKVVVGFDAQPGRGSCRTSDWWPGEFIVDELELVPPSDLGSAPTYLELGMYDLATGVRLAGSGLSQNRVLVGPLAVAP
jgi:hypothetical protein